MNDAIHYFVPTKDHAPLLCAMARQVFSDTIARLYAPIPFAQFLEEAYGPGGSMERELAVLRFAGRWLRWAISRSGTLNSRGWSLQRQTRTQERWSYDKYMCSDAGMGEV